MTALRRTAGSFAAQWMPAYCRSRMAPVSQPLPTVVLVLSAALGPFAMHLLVPAIPAIASDLAIPYGTAQLIVAVYLVGFSLAQLAYGPLSDRFGRKPLLLAGVG